MQKFDKWRYEKWKPVWDFLKFVSRYMKKVYPSEVFWNINSPCFCLKYLGNLKSENNVLTVSSDKFLKPFR